MLPDSSMLLASRGRPHKLVLQDDPHNKRRQWCRSRRPGTAVSAVAAPSRPTFVPSPNPQTLLVRRSPEQARQLANMLSQSSDTREPPPSPSSSSRNRRDADADSQPSTSGRGTDPSSSSSVRDLPFLPGSRTRVARSRTAGASRRPSTSAASFYGEYCDLLATQRMVSKIWRRIVVEPDRAAGATPAPAAPTNRPATAPADRAADRAAAPAPAPAAAAARVAPAVAAAEPNGVAAGGSARPAGRPVDRAVAAGAAVTAVTAVTVAPPTPDMVVADGTPTSRREVSFRATQATQTTLAPTLTTTATVGVGVAERADASSDDDGRDALASSPAAAAAPRKATVLYSGPEFALDLASRGRPLSTATGATDAASEGEELLSEEEVEEGRSAPPPRRVRGSRLGLPGAEKWRAVWTAVREPGAETGVGAGAENWRAVWTAVRETETGAGAGAENWRAVWTAARETGAGPGPGAGPRRQQYPGFTHPLRTTGSAPLVEGRAEAEAEAEEVAGTEEEGQQRGQQREERRGQQRGQERGPGRHTQSQSHQASASASASASDAALGSASPGTGTTTPPREGADPAPPDTSPRTSRKAEQRALLRAVLARVDDAKLTELLRAHCYIRGDGKLSLNNLLQHLGEMGYGRALCRVLRLSVGLGLANEHTHAVAFRALHRMGRLDLALEEFQGAARSGHDIGPLGCSALLQAAAEGRNAKMAWQLLETMLSTRMSLNRFSFNVMAHLLAGQGALDDVVLLYKMMKAEAAGESDLSSGPRPECAPDAYTFSALVKAATTAGRPDLLPSLFNEMVAQHRAAMRARGGSRGAAAAGSGGGRGTLPSGAPGAEAAVGAVEAEAVEGEVLLTQELWGTFIANASRCSRPDMALRFFDVGLVEMRAQPNPHIYNSLLAAMARTRPLGELFQVYREMLSGTFLPLGPRIMDGTLGRPDVQQRPSSAPTPTAAAAGAAHPAKGAPGGLLAPDVEQPVLRPDHYTFNALLTAAAEAGTDMATLALIRREMRRRGVALNFHIASSLICALRKSAEMSRAAAARYARAAPPPPPATGAAADAAAPAPAAVLAAAARVVQDAEEIMARVVRDGKAGAALYISMAALYATAGRPEGVVGTVRELLRLELLADGLMWRFLLGCVEEAEMFGLVAPLERAMEQQRRQWQEAAARRQQAAVMEARQRAAAGPPGKD